MKIATFATVLALLASATAQAAAVSGMGTWETTLQARDLTGDGVADAFYDVVQDKTWLASGSQSGDRIFASAAAWVEGLNIGGFTGWRLPSSLDSSGHWCYGYRCVDTELGRLWLITLGNLDTTVFNGNSPIQNTGDFDGLAGYYWTDLCDHSAFWQDYFETSHGFSSYGQANFIELKALPVHDGDIGGAISTVAEPSSAALVFASLGLLWGLKRGRRGDA